LLLRECFIDGFRCVWQFDASSGAGFNTVAGYRIKSFGPTDAGQFEKLKREVESSSEPVDPQIPRVEDGWLNYCVFTEANQPCALGSLYAKAPSAYLSWWFTQPAHRGRGLQQWGIHQRVRDAQQRGCGTIFTVTDFNFSSPANLQRCGFRLAYNYLLVRKEMAAVGLSS
jgi:hypothetical protein